MSTGLSSGCLYVGPTDVLCKSSHVLDGGPDHPLDLIFLDLDQLTVTLFILLLRHHSAKRAIVMRIVLQ